MRSQTAFRLSVCLGIVAPASAQNLVQVVDRLDRPGTDHTSLQAAIDAAPEGGILLIRNGNHLPVVIDGKSIHLEEDTLLVEQEARLAGIVVRNLAPGQSVTVRGLDVYDFDQEHYFELTDNAGSVLFEDVMTGLVPHSRGSLGLIEDCDSVVFSRVTAYVSRDHVDPLSPVFEIRRSNVQFFDSVVGARNISEGDPVLPNTVIEGGRVGLYGSHFYGTNNPFHSCAPPDGGDVFVLEGGAVLELQDSNVEPGPSVCDPTAPGEAFVIVSGTVVNLPSRARTHFATSPVREGQNVGLHFEGRPGDRVWVFMSSSITSPLISRRFDAPFLLSMPLAQQTFVGTLPADGKRSFARPLGDLPPGLTGMVGLVQAAFLDANATRFVLSEPSALTLLDGSIPLPPP